MNNIKRINRHKILACEHDMVYKGNSNNPARMKHYEMVKKHLHIAEAFENNQDLIEQNRTLSDRLIEVSLGMFGDANDIFEDDRPEVITEKKKLKITEGSLEDHIKHRNRHKGLRDYYSHFSKIIPKTYEHKLWFTRMARVHHNAYKAHKKAISHPDSENISNAMEYTKIANHLEKHYKKVSHRNNWN